MWIYYTPNFKDENGIFPVYYYASCLLLNAAHSVFIYSMFVSQMSFFAQISDKNIGGTYMTFLNTITNFGGNWPSTVALFLASHITVKQCTSVQKDGNTLTLANNTCTNEIDIKVRVLLQLVGVILLVAYSNYLNFRTARASVACVSQQSTHSTS